MVLEVPIWSTNCYSLNRLEPIRKIFPSNSAKSSECTNSQFSHANFAIQTFSRNVYKTHTTIWVNSTLKFSNFPSNSVGTVRLFLSCFESIASSRRPTHLITFERWASQAKWRTANDVPRTKAFWSSTTIHKNVSDMSWSSSNRATKMVPLWSSRWVLGFDSDFISWFLIATRIWWPDCWQWTK